MPDRLAVLREHHEVLVIPKQCETTRYLIFQPIFLWTFLYRKERTANVRLSLNNCMHHGFWQTYLQH